jgi:rhodanese-related sulfurtransferase
MMRTKNTAAKILTEKGYTNPEALSSGISEQMRQKKVDEKDLIAEMT